MPTLPTNYRCTRNLGQPDDINKLKALLYLEILSINTCTENFNIRIENFYKRLKRLEECTNK
jgi:hypothetical protein